MFLKSLQIQGFKSFPDKIKLEFQQGITATVGPNGSGKSNISDAVRWVLGEQAPSALRIKTMEDVIFEGTKTRKASGFAEVIIAIDNTKRWLSPDTDEVTVGRRYYRSGTSEYRINGKIVRLLDVNELFADTGIGKSGYSMIGQGKISDIVDARAHDRRVIFEEAAGISKYRERRRDAERNLDKTQENLTHLDVILSGLEERVGPLEKESEKAKKYLDLREKYKRAEIGLWLTTLSKTTDILRDQNYRLTLLASQRAELEEKATELDAQAEELYLESSRLAAEKDERLHRASELEENAARLDGEAAVIDNDIAHDRSDIARIEEEIKQAAEAGGQIAGLIAAKQDEIKQIAEKISQCGSLCADYRAQIESLRSSESGQNSQLAALREKQNKLTVRLSEYNMSLARAQSQLEAISQRSGSVGQLISECEARAAELEASRSRTEQALGAVKDQAASLGNTVSGYRMRLDKQRGKADEVKRQIDDLRLDAQDKLRRANTIEDLERNLEGYDYSIRMVMQEKERGGLRGIHGPVSRVITVDTRYAAAIEVALGAAMKNIIVDSENDGKQAMEFLKRTRAGRATFLPISVIRPRSLDERGLDECAGYIDVASMLVSCDEAYRGIIDNLLGKVCVVEDIDSAISIARRFKNRFRIVTLDGQVINAGGSMTGGSMDKKSGLLLRRGELEKLRAQAKEISDKASALQQEYAALMQKAGSDEAALLAAQSELACAGEDRMRFEADLRIIGEQAQDNDQRLSDLIAERDGAQQRIADITAERDEAQNGADQCSAELAQISAQIDKNTGSIDELSRQREELAEKLSAAGMEQISLTKESESISAQIAELEARISQGSEREAAQRLQIAVIGGHISELGGKADSLRADAEKNRSDAKAARAGIIDIQTRRDEIETAVRDKRRQSKEAIEQRESISAEYGKLEARIEQTQKDHDTIITKMMEEYNITRREAAEQYEPAENEREAQRTVSEIRGKIKALGSVNVGAIEEYKEVSEKYRTYKTQIDDVIRSKEELEKLIEDLTVTMRQMFLDTFAKINKNFGEIFPELFGGGSAKMSLVDDEDCLECGIDIEITPPGKEKRSIMGMSGGEKSIIAVAIYFAIMKVKPSPFCFLDEIDHALDEHNVNNIAQYIKRFTSTTQYVVITHRRGMMEAASMLYGVTKQDGISKLLSLSLSEIEEKLGSIE